jgi:copper chaperone CopZ
MIRRQFIKLAALTGATGFASIGAMEALRQAPASAAGEEPLRTVTWRVRGFTCATCAVGLETLLSKKEGVIAASAAYPQGTVTIRYRSDLVRPDALRSAIAELGFAVDDQEG